MNEYHYKKELLSNRTHMAQSHLRHLQQEIMDSVFTQIGTSFADDAGIILGFWDLLTKRYPDWFIKLFSEQSTADELFSLTKIRDGQRLLNDVIMEHYLERLEMALQMKGMFGQLPDLPEEMEPEEFHNRWYEVLLNNAAGRQTIVQWLRQTYKEALNHSLEQQIPQPELNSVTQNKPKVI